MLARLVISSGVSHVTWLASASRPKLCLVQSEGSLCLRSTKLLACFLFSSLGVFSQARPTRSKVVLG